MTQRLKLDSSLLEWLADQRSVLATSELRRLGVRTGREELQQGERLLQDVGTQCLRRLIWIITSFRLEELDALLIFSAKYLCFSPLDKDVE